MAILIVIAAAVFFFCLGLLFKPSRRLIGALLLALGLLTCLTGIGMVVGLPILSVGALIILIEYGGHRHRRHASDKS